MNGQRNTEIGNSQGEDCYNGIENNVLKTARSNDKDVSGMGENTAQTNPFIIGSLMREEAEQLCTWLYDPPYDVYNLPAWETVCANGWELSNDAARKREYRAVRKHGELFAFGRIFRLGSYVLIGIGLKPEDCGQGSGRMVLEILLKEAREMYPGIPLALEVRTFNERAIQCYRKAGFEITKKYRRGTLDGEDDFYLMEESSQRFHTNESK